MRHNESDPDRPTTDPSSPTPSRPTDGTSDKGDPEEFQRRCPFVWDELSEEEVRDRVDHYSLPGTDDLLDRLDVVLQQTGQPLDPAELLYRPVVGMLKNLLYDECKKNNRLPIYDLAETLIWRLEDAAKRGRTWGEQRLALFHRYPYAWTDVRSLAPLPPEDDLSDTEKQSDSEGGENRPAIGDVRLARLWIDRLRYLRITREIESLQEQIGEILPKDKRQRRRLTSAEKNRIADALLKRFPELTHLLPEGLGRSGSVDDLNPDRAACHIWGHRQKPTMMEKTVRENLAIARRERLWRRSMSRYIDKHPEEFKPDQQGSPRESK